jgi:hypothetical protein
MTSVEQSASRFKVKASDERQEETRQPSATPVVWSYTLAYAETPLRDRALSAEALSDLAETLRARGIPLPADFASSRARARLTSGPLSGARYIWGFTTLRDALQAARATRRSDYHAYPEPATLREASLDRLYYRFPLAEFPRASVILFSGAPVCPDPLLGPDPTPGSLAAELADALGPEAWERYTLLGFRQGLSLVRVMPADRWVRLAPRALEESWEAADRALRALPLPEADDGGNAENGEATSPARPAPPDPESMESAAFQALLRILTGVASEPAPAPAYAPMSPRRARIARARQRPKRQELRG